ncbi:MAG: hypothetical protein HY564_02595 [Candidatus Jacksonbacteria bacterium]|nr:hypothetical protein [Candidatus Jacksonbacteria bacterium]
MTLSPSFIQQLAANRETAILLNSEGEPILVIVPYERYKSLYEEKAPVKETARSENPKEGLTSEELLDNINRQIAERKQEQQIPIMPADDSVIQDDENAEEDRLYLEDI